MKKIVVGDCFQSGNDTIIADRLQCPNGIDLVVGFHVQERVEIGFRPSVLAGNELPTLHLPISEPWFSRILSGEKTEEYREIWGQNDTGRNISILTTTTARDAKDELQRMDNDYGKGALPIFINHLKSHCLVSTKVLHLTNGYGHHRPQLWAHIEEITIGRGKPEWGAPTDRDVFIIKLGEVFHTKNLKVVN